MVPPRSVVGSNCVAGGVTASRPYLKSLHSVSIQAYSRASVGIHTPPALVPTPFTSLEGDRLSDSPHRAGLMKIDSERSRCERCRSRRPARDRRETRRPIARVRGSDSWGVRSPRRRCVSRSSARGRRSRSDVRGELS